jgi:alpha-D-xyloside xylohydrolase
MGVGALKVDFGEGAPIAGQYASGRSGWHEHNLYPLRYNKAAFEITREVTGDSIIWARSAWAGSQRYPIHWGGDAENTDCGMAASLRGGLSLGLCGFSFWSHDIGGFVRRSPREVYRRWMPFGMLTSHSRCHGAPPKEPWEYDPEFEADFRRAVELKYRLMPYVYAQAVTSADHGYPMLRALFFEYPDDPAAWLVEDQYFFGRDLLVAPLIDAHTRSRDVYLPPGKWIDYQTRQHYSGGRFCHISAGDIPCVILVRAGAALPHIPLAQSTAEMDWSRIELVVFADKDTTEADALVALPADNVPHFLQLDRKGERFALRKDPLKDRVTWDIRLAR